MAAISGKAGKLRFTSASASSSTGEAATLAADGLSVSINDATKRHFNPSVKPLLYLNTTQVAVGNYTVESAAGRVRFGSTQSTGTYTIDASYFTASYLANVRSWGANIQVNMLDATVWTTSTGAVQWRNFQPGLSQASVTVGKLVSTGTTGPVFYDRLNSTDHLALDLYSSGTNGFTCYAKVDQDQYRTQIDQLANENVTLAVTSGIYYSTV